jgi:hypothetical protein
MVLGAGLLDPEGRVSYHLRNVSKLVYEWIFCHVSADLDLLNIAVRNSDMTFLEQFFLPLNYSQILRF